MKRNLAWHFVGKTLRDGSPIPADRKWLEFKGPLKFCESGLHWSKEPFDALQYAPGSTLCLVEYGGKVVKEDDKGASSKRKIIARMDASELLRYFARMQALSVLHLWEKEPPEVVCDYLITGDESIRSAARAAAWVAGAAARAAAWAAGAAGDAGDAAGDVAWAAAWAAWAAAGAAWAAGDAAKASARQEFNSLVYECFSDWL